MVRSLILVSLLLASGAADRRACAASFDLTRLTDNSWEEMAGMVDRVLIMDQAICPNTVFVGSTASGNAAVLLAWKPDAWVVQPIVEGPSPLSGPSVAGAPSGAVHVAYCRMTESGNIIEHTRIVGGDADPPEPVSPEDPSVSHPSIAVGPDGTVHVVFCLAEWIYYVRREASGWSSPEWLAEGRLASLAVGPNGECHVVYQWMDPQRMYSVWYLHGGSGAWSSPEHLAGVEALQARHPTVAVDPEGDVHTAYEQYLPDDRVIDYRVHRAGVWSASEHVASGEVPAIAVDAGGHPCVAFWATWPLYCIAASVRDVPVSSAISSGWATVPVDPEARFGHELPLRPGIAWDNAGEVHVIYDSRDPRGGDDVEMWYAKGSMSTGVERTSPADHGTLSCWPNPALRSLMLRWVPAAPGWTRVTVSDVRGRHIRTLREGAFAAVEQVLTWDGLDAHGRRVPAGVYWLRVSDRRAEAVRKVVLIGD